MSRKHMEQSGCGQLTTDMLNWRCTICSACEPCSAIQSIQKPVFRRYLPIRCAYNTHRCLDLEIWQFSCWWQWQTYRPITLPLAHARGVISGNAHMPFLEFIDCNSQLNGRSEESSSATHFFLPKFRTIQTPKDGVPRYEQHMSESLVGVFNCATVQREKGRDTILELLGSRKKDQNMLSHHTS